jgi:ABC-2 type transport system permease protein
MRRRAVWLVARREVVTRVRDRTLLVSTLVTLLLLAAIVALPELLGGEEDRVRVAAATPADAQVLQTARRLDPALSVVAERDPVAAVRADRVDAALTGGRLVVADADADAEALARTLAQAAGLATLAPADRDRALGGSRVEVRALDGGDDTREGLAFLAVVLLYGQLIGYGFWIAAGIVEEKASRVVEVLLATLRPRELLAGKVLGIGAVALAQLLLIGLIGVALGLAVGSLDVPGDALSALAIVLAFFLLGYAFYAALFAVAGALVPRQEEVQNTTTPLTLLLLASFFLSFTALDDPGGTLARVLSLVPPSAPMVLPVRLIAGEVAVWEVAAGVALLLVAAAALIAFAARVYEGAVLQTRTRVRLREALSARRTTGATPTAAPRARA